MLFDFSTRKWEKLLTDSFVRDIIWSGVEEANFVLYTPLSQEQPSISRLRISDRKLDEIVPPQWRTGAWLGLTPDDSPLITRPAGTQEIYALDWQAR